MSNLKLNESAELEQKDESTLIGENIDENEECVQNEDKNILKRNVSMNEEERLVVNF